MSRIAITGLGIVSAAGVGVDATEAALRADRSKRARGARSAAAKDPAS